MRVLVTGGSGFIGARLIGRLRQDSADVRALVRPGGARRPLPAEVRRLEVELGSADDVRKAVQAVRPSVIFHCAMPSGHPKTAAERSETLETAVLGTAHLAEAALEVGVRRFVHLGSFLGYRPQTRAIRETDPIEPTTPRGAAKAAASVWLQQFARTMRLPAVELRLFSVYGPGEGDHRFIPVLLRAARDGSSVELRRGVSRDLVYVDDVVDACLRASEADLPEGSVFNIGGGRAWSNEETVEAVRQASGKPIDLSGGAYPAKGSDGSWLADIHPGVGSARLTPKRSLHAGLTETLQWLT